MNARVWPERLNVADERLAVSSGLLSGVCDTQLATGGGRPVDVAEEQVSGTGGG